MIESLLRDIGRGSGAEAALADWLEEHGEVGAARLARGLVGWDSPDATAVLEAVRRAGGEAAVAEETPWHDHRHTARRMRKILWRDGRRWGVATTADGRVKIRAAPSRGLRGKMSTPDWHVLEAKVAKIREQLVIRCMYEVEVPPNARIRANVLEAIAAGTTNT
jgi:hypothetical protein